MKVKTSVLIDRLKAIINRDGTRRYEIDANVESVREDSVLESDENRRTIISLAYREKVVQKEEITIAEWEAVS